MILSIVFWWFKFLSIICLVIPNTLIISNPLEYLLYSWGRWGDGGMGRWGDGGIPDPPLTQPTPAPPRRGSWRGIWGM